MEGKEKQKWSRKLQNSRLFILFSFFFLFFLGGRKDEMKRKKMDRDLFIYRNKNKQDGAVV